MVVSSPAADPGRPCWVAVGDDRHEGTVHAWYRDEVTGEWHALVVAWLPGEQRLAAWVVSELTVSKPSVDCRPYCRRWTLSSESGRGS